MAGTRGSSRGARKRKNSGENDKAKGGAKNYGAVGIENVNSYSASVKIASPKRRKSLITSPRKKGKGKGKSTKNANSHNAGLSDTDVELNRSIDETVRVNEDQSNPSSQENSHMEVVQFQEDGNEIQVEVTALTNEFMSEGGLDSDHEDDEGNLSQVSLHAEGHEGHESDHSSNSSPSSQSESEDEEEKRRLERKRQKKIRCKSIEDKLDTMGETLRQMQSMLTKKGIFSDGGEETPGTSDPNRNVNYDNSRRKGKQGHEISNVSDGAKTGESQTTIYHSAVEFQDKTDGEVTFNFKENEKWVSSSSDEPVDTSDELLDVGNQIDKSLTEIRCGNSGERGRVNDAPTACRPDEGERIIREAEASRARLHTSPGKVQTNRCITNWQNMNEIQTSAVDEKYLVIGLHVDAALQAKIINHEYIDFARLLPKDRITIEDDHRLELVNKGGMTYFAPIADHEMVGINSFSKW